MWRKLGKVYEIPNGGLHHTLQTHAANPLAVWLEGDVYRIFYSGRDAKNRSSVGAVDFDILKLEILFEHKEPFFTYGPEGSFYCDGVSIGNCYSVENKKLILFMGWQNPLGEHWRGDIGQLLLDDNAKLQIIDTKPLLSTDEIDQISLSYPWVHFNYQGVYEMWYGSTKTWDAGNQEMLHVLNYANSLDGYHWEKYGLSVPYEIGVAQAFSRPTVAITKAGGLEMWFSYRAGGGDKYKIGYAQCNHLDAWELKLGHAGISCSEHGWDSEMICYPYVFDHCDRRYMLYNGNGYGKTGFGLAVWDDK